MENWMKIVFQIKWLGNQQKNDESGDCDAAFLSIWDSKQKNTLKN